MSSQPFSFQGPQTTLASLYFLAFPIIIQSNLLSPVPAVGASGSPAPRILDNSQRCEAVAQLQHELTMILFTHGARKSCLFLNPRSRLRVPITPPDWWRWASPPDVNLPKLNLTLLVCLGSDGSWAHRLTVDIIIFISYGVSSLENHSHHNVCLSTICTEWTNCRS